jgi:hypothetical protein
MRIGRAMGNFADNFRNLQLHRIPFLTTQLLTLLIPKMRALQVLGIYNCPLIHIGNTLELLGIIKMDKPLEKEKQISLDFYPNYHQGPPCTAGGESWTGTYAVTWDNWGADSRLAIWALVARILPQAQKQDIDFVSKGTMFRKWLDKTPCLNIEETIKAILDHSMQPEKFVSLIDYRHYQGDVGKLIDTIANRPEGWHWYVRY